MEARRFMPSVPSLPNGISDVVKPSSSSLQYGTSSGDPSTFGCIDNTVYSTQMMSINTNARTVDHAHTNQLPLPNPSMESDSFLA